MQFRKTGERKYLVAVASDYQITMISRHETIKYLLHYGLPLLIENTEIICHEQRLHYISVLDFRANCFQTFNYGETTSLPILFLVGTVHKPALYFVVYINEEMVDF